MGHELTSLVECHAGFTYAERPLALHLGGERKMVSQVTAAWRSPRGRCFRVSTIDGSQFALAYDEFDDLWQVKPA